MFSQFIGKALVTWFGLGKVPVAPGTAGSIGAIPLCFLMAEPSVPLWQRFVFAIGWTAIAILASMHDQKTSAVRDPSYIVIDEVAGMLWSTLFLGMFYIPSITEFKSILVAFLAFRFFDVLKPFPARHFDKSSKTASNAFGRGFHIVMDDVIAGIYASVFVAVFFHPKIQALTELLN